MMTPGIIAIANYSYSLLFLIYCPRKDNNTALYIRLYPSRVIPITINHMHVCTVVYTYTYTTP